jgi:flagellin-like hook-associated protein FlgL
MPIPLLVWIGGVLVAGAIGTSQVVTAKNRYVGAQSRYAERRTEYESIVADLGARHDEARTRFEEFGKNRLKSAILLGEAAKFLERAKLKDRDLLVKLNIPEQTFIEWKAAAVQAEDVLGGVAQAAGAGAVTAAAAFSLVGALAAASTGTAIATLSGVAATNATLAWLGGGALAAGGGGMAAGTAGLGGLVVAPALLVAGVFANMKAGEVETKFEKHIAELDEDEANKQKAIAALGALMARVDELDDSTTKLSDELKRLLVMSVAEDEADAYLVSRTAVALGQLLEVAVLDREGKPL